MNKIKYIKKRGHTSVALYKVTEVWPHFFFNSCRSKTQQVKQRLHVSIIMKKSTVHNYSLQWGRALPKKFFEVPETVYVPAKSHCCRHGYREYHDFQKGKPCLIDCRGCIEEDSDNSCHVCGRKQHEDPNRRFVEKAEVEETANGLLEAWRNHAVPYVCRRDDPVRPGVPSVFERWYV